MKILFVCTGNTCRSPMAAALLAKAAAESGLRIEVLSAGTGAAEYQPATPEALGAMRDLDIDLSAHRSRRLSADLVAAADLILTMTAAQRATVRLLAPEAAGKVFTLLDFAGTGTGHPGQEVTVSQSNPSQSSPVECDIPDPIGQPLEHYRRCAAILQDAVRAVVGRLSAMEPATEARRGEGGAMRVALGGDHGGYRLKEAVKGWLDELGVAYEDFGAHSLDSVDYPDYARVVAERVASGEFDRGILVCGTGIGMAIAANKVPGVRAALCHDVFSARATREHNDSNVLTLGERVVGPGLARAIVEAWLEAGFGGGRHVQRVEKIRAIEEAYSQCRREKY